MPLDRMVNYVAINVHKHPPTGYIASVFCINPLKKCYRGARSRDFSNLPRLATLPHQKTDRCVGPMKGILLFAALLLAICATSLGISAALPSPDGALFAIAILLSATFTAVSLCIELSEGRINDMRDVMKVIETGRSVRLTLAAYGLGCSLAAATTVLVYRGLLGG